MNSQDPHIANIFSAEEEDCLSLEQMTAYQQDKLAGQEKNRVERHLLNCELCAITIDSVIENGSESIANGAVEISDQAWDRVQARDNRQRRGAYFWIASAASIALLVMVGYFTFRGPTEQEIEHALADAQQGIGIDQSGILMQLVVEVENIFMVVSAADGFRTLLD